MLGHWYPWATPDYLLRELSWAQIQMYLFQMPAEMWRSVFLADPHKPDLAAIKKLRMGKIIR